MLLHTLFVTGILLTFLKVADLLLLPKQQTKLQKSVETLTLYLSYNIPIFSLRFQKVFSPRLIKFLIFIPFLYFLCSELTMDLKDNWNLLFLTGLFILTGTFVIAPLSSIRRILKGRQNLWNAYSNLFLLSFVSFLLFSVGALCNMTLLNNRDIEGFSTGSFSWTLSNLLLLLFHLIGIMFLQLFLISIFAGLIFLFFDILYDTSRKALKIFEAIMWRIALYSKGAWIAIISIITFFLGIFELCIKNI